MTENTVRYEETESDQPLVIGTLYVQKWAAHRLEDRQTLTLGLLRRYSAAGHGDEDGKV